MANSVGPDQMPCSAASDQGLHCLQRHICPNSKGYYGIYSWPLNLYKYLYVFQSEPIYVPLKYDDKSSSSSDINELTGMAPFLNPLSPVDQTRYLSKHCRSR